MPFVSTLIQPPSSPSGNQPVLLSSGHIPKIPLFSGEDPVPRNAITFYEWRHEVRCLMQDSTYISSQVLQAIRNSLRGTARKLVSLGDSASVDLIFQKLDVNFAEPARKGITMKEFFNASQKLEETVTSFGCRLEAILEQAFEGGHLPRSAKNELMCERLWSGLHSEALKSSTRHKLDSSQQYDQLLKDIRQVEKELKLSNPPKTRAHSNVQIQQQYAKTTQRFRVKIQLSGFRDSIQCGPAV
ncbi:hypothetical protein DPMN_013490 [Dreissena polymorpha]|uniref:Paraneoplastic antigen Ma-like C-terminal domain-containing protein n=1 Tax=Dreissena polymorpha TaxID=45954 RepID=A0A9D4N7W1_DREPO|nr:hypothetical protein DPMN_013490 [Dreissena polymorpha]